MNKLNLISVMSDFIDHNLKVIRTALTLTVVAAGTYIILTSRHSIKITSVDSIVYFPRRLGGEFLVKDHRIYFNHIPAFHRLIYTPSKETYDLKECIPVEWVEMKVRDEAAVRSAIDGRSGKLIVYGKRDDMAQGTILVKSHSYSPILRDPAFPLLKTGAIVYTKIDLLPEQVSRRYERVGEGNLAWLWRFLRRKEDIK
jgi:hypothetical protein